RAENPYAISVTSFPFPIQRAVKINDPGALDAYACRIVNSPCKTAFGFLPAAQQNRAAMELGRWLARARRDAAQSKSETPGNV
ncbi:MAG: hypothetical protein ABL951_17060, partial [Alphaproteobacteria bacterium]